MEGILKEGIYFQQERGTKGKRVSKCFLINIVICRMQFSFMPKFKRVRNPIPFSKLQKLKITKQLSFLSSFIKVAPHYGIIKFGLKEVSSFNLTQKNSCQKQENNDTNSHGVRKSPWRRLQKQKKSKQAILGGKISAYLKVKFITRILRVFNQLQLE